MTISIAMTAYRRARQLDNTLASIKAQTMQPDQIVVVEDGDLDKGATRDVCIKWKNDGLPVEYYQRYHRPPLPYSNPAIPKNISIRKCTGEYLFIQCAEVMFTKPTDIANMMRPMLEHRSDRNIAVCAPVSGRLPNGDFEKWYAGPNRKGAGGVEWYLDFCQVQRLDKVLEIGGFEEAYNGYGFDDDDFSYRLRFAGVVSQWANDVECHHQWHGYDGPPLMDDVNHGRYKTAVEELSTGKRTPEANVGKKWGDINS